MSKGERDDRDNHFCREENEGNRSYGGRNRASSSCLIYHESWEALHYVHRARYGTVHADECIDLLG